MAPASPQGQGFLFRLTGPGQVKVDTAGSIYQEKLWFGEICLVFVTKIYVTKIFRKRPVREVAISWDRSAANFPALLYADILSF